MEIEIAPRQRMSETGSSLLRLIQNQEMPLWDLLVREAVQNSLDAALDGDGYVQVDFSIRNFRRMEFAKHFTGISERLNVLFPDETYRLLEIRDSNTVGLTGPLQETDLQIKNYGNLVKLVYHVGMPQQKEGSGGSWGLGKTVYYRVGIGLVIYYSRIFEDGKYKSRLAACLVEDEEKETGLLKTKDNHRGIAWWGKKTENGETTVALTDDVEISRVLGTLGVKPFENEKTGTVVVIPFLRDDLRQLHGDPDEDNQNPVNPWWNHDDVEYIKIALQKWYAPRLMNEKYKHGRWLKASVNGEFLEPSGFLPVFQLIQKLYNCSLVSVGGDTRKVDGIDAPLFVSPVNLRGSFDGGTTAGWLAFGRFSEKDLKMSPPHNNYSPWVQIFGRDMAGDSNPPIICFTRKPGMIVGYEFVGKWTDGISRTAKNEYTIGIFVANSANVLKEEFKKSKDAEYTLEEYIRGCEKADHAAWQDWVPDRKNPFIIEKIQRQVTRIVENRYKVGENNIVPAKNVVLGKLLAKAILPPEGFGKLGNIQKAGGGNRLDGAARRRVGPVLLQVSHPSYEHEFARIAFRLHSGKSSAKFMLKLGAVTESSNIDSEAWEKDDKGTGTPFPVQIMRFELQSDGKENRSKIIWDSWDGVSCTGEVKVEKIVKTPVFGKTVGFEISGESNRSYDGAIWIKSDDPLLHVSLYVE